MNPRQSFSQWRPHPWHGLETGPAPPALVNAYIEITPFDLVKYEVDKATGYLSVDRPQRGSSCPPTLYGFIPQTLCGDSVADLSPAAAGGDGDPMDICVLSERPIARSEVVIKARVVGGFQMLDGGEADDKIVGVLHNDLVWGEVRDISELPRALVERLEHYFATYKLVPGSASDIRIERIYGHDHAHTAIEASMRDYARTFGDSGSAQPA